MWSIGIWPAAWLSGPWPAIPRPPRYRHDEVQAEFDRFTAEAEELVAAATGLRSTAGPARGRVIDRAGWVRANVASIQRLLGPTLEKVEAQRKVAPP